MIFLQDSVNHFLQSLKTLYFLSLINLSHTASLEKLWEKTDKVFYWTKGKTKKTFREDLS